jgi:hypothetical protein
VLPPTVFVPVALGSAQADVATTVDEERVGDLVEAISAAP